MTNRYDVLAGREYTDRDGNKKTSWTRLGSMWPNRSGDGFSIKLDAIPAPQEGVYQLACFPPREDNAPQQQRKQPNHPMPGDLEDEIPF